MESLVRLAQTGATPEQIASAIERASRKHPNTGATAEQMDAAMERRRRRTQGYSDRSIDRSTAEVWASLIVPPDHRIVALADLDELTLHAELDGADRALVARMRALIGAE